MINTSVPIVSNELCLLWQGSQYLREKFIYLKRSSIDWKKFQSVQPNEV